MEAQIYFTEQVPAFTSNTLTTQSCP